MAELQITVPYKLLPARIVFTTMCVLFPVWSMIAPIALGLLIGRVITNPMLLPVQLTVLACVSLLTLILGSIAVTAVSEDNRIHVSKDGISFPPMFLPKLQFQRARSWSELTNAKLIASDTGKWLLLSFRTEHPIPLKLERMAESDIEQLMLAVELWAASCERSPELIEYQTAVQNRGHGVDKVGYTQMWEEELGRRFQSTSFVPLEPDNQLQEGRLKVVRQLAFGGLSAIYLAQRNQRDMVVLKEAVVPPSADPETRQQAEQHLLREAEMLQRIDHPNIAHVLDHFTENGRHYLMLEYINGQDLRQYVQQNGPVDQKTAIAWGVTILQILHVLHSLNPPMLHRDLTPENLVLTKHGIVLIDFGAANQFVGNATGTVVGKQAYIPPEQLRGKSSVESDLYAFGGTMHFLLTGKDPLPLSTSHPKSFVSQIDDDLDALIAKCSEFESGDRYHSAAEILELLQALSQKLNAGTIADAVIEMST